MPTCSNCDAALQGRWCHACGQNSDVRTDSLRGFVEENLSDLAHVDSRGFRTLRDLLLRPGRLTHSYFRGQRVRYVSAVQLYLIAAALFFFASSIRPFIVVDGSSWSVQASLGVMTITESLDSTERAPIEASGIGPGQFEDRLRSTANSQMPAFLVGVVVLFALLVGATHLLADRNVLKHVVFALHWTAFYLLLMLGERAAALPPGEGPVLRLILAVIGLVWLAIALRTTYGQRWWWVVPKAVVLFTGFHTLLALWIAVVLAWGIRAIAA